MKMRDPVKNHIQIRKKLEAEEQRLKQKKELHGALVHVFVVLLTPPILFLLLIFNIKED